LRARLDKLSRLADPIRNDNPHERALASAKLAELKSQLDGGANNGNKAMKSSTIFTDNEYDGPGSFSYNERQIEKRHRPWHNIVIGLIIFLYLRHMNTVDHREWTEGSYSIYTAEGLFGSSYRAKKDGVDLGYSSKRFGEVFLRALGTTPKNLEIIRAIDPDPDPDHNITGTGDTDEHGDN
jgi:hypothetical protein